MPTGKHPICVSKNFKGLRGIIPLKHRRRFYQISLPRTASKIPQWQKIQRVEPKPRFTPEYVAYLKSPQWHERRRAALHRAEYRCQRCGTTGQLVVHHRTYKNLFHEIPDDLEALCDPCHRAIHGHLQEKPQNGSAINRSSQHAQLDTVVLGPETGLPPPR